MNFNKYCLSNNMCELYVFQERGIEGEVKGEVGAGEKSPESGGASPGGQCV